MVAKFYLPGTGLPAWSLWALALIFVAPFLPMVWHAVEGWRRRRRAAAGFHDRARAKGLSPDQGRLLLRLARRQGAAEPVVVLRSAARFDRCVHGDGRMVDRKTARELMRIRAVLGFHQLLPGDRLRSTRQLGRGHRLLLRRPGLDAEDGALWVVEAQDDHALVATPLLSDLLGGIDVWQPGSRVEGQFRHGTDSTYAFVTDVFAVEPEPQRLLLRHTQRVERVQQRAFFRLATQFPIVLLVGEGTAPEDSEQASRLEGTVVDISGGGLSVRVPIPPADGAHLTVDPAFAGPFPLAGIGCQLVARLERQDGVVLRLRFVEVSAELEGAIVRGIYRRQLGVGATSDPGQGGRSASPRSQAAARSPAGAPG